jgi:hypothetical protein
VRKEKHVMITAISIDCNEEWDRTVKTFKSYDVYYLSGYLKAFEIHGDGKPLLIFYDDGKIRAINVVMKRDIAIDRHFVGKIPVNTFFDITTPYGYGGFLLEGDATSYNIDKMGSEYCSLCIKEEIICEFVRFHPILKNNEYMEALYSTSRLGSTVSIDLISKEQVWSDFTSKNRNVIRKSQKSGVEIKIGLSDDLFKEFIKIYNSTMDKDNASRYYYFGEEFYKSILNDLKQNALIFYAIHENNIIAMSIILFANNQMHYHLSASKREFQHLAPTNLLLYEAACWGIEKGYKSFHLGGGFGGCEDSLFKFKNAFNRNYCNEFNIGRKIFDNDKYNALLQIRKNDDGFNEETKYFPVYRR